MKDYTTLSPEKLARIVAKGKLARDELDRRKPVPATAPPVASESDEGAPVFTALSDPEANVHKGRGTYNTATGTLTPAEPAQAEPTYPCSECGTLRTKAEGGTTFTVCDECWDALHRASRQTSRSGSG